MSVNMAKRIPAGLALAERIPVDLQPVAKPTSAAEEALRKSRRWMIHGIARPPGIDVKWNGLYDKRIQGNTPKAKSRMVQRPKGLFGHCDNLPHSSEPEGSGRGVAGGLDTKISHETLANTHLGDDRWSSGLRN